ncbi:hypothetical protein [Sphaerisporangium fuscum]|nr:hypothetical protein [Sphaerisporangium fuscum]
MFILDDDVDPGLPADHGVDDSAGATEIRELENKVETSSSRPGRRH